MKMISAGKDFIESLRGKTIVAVNPPVLDFAFYDLWAKPLGLLYLLDFLSESNKVFLVDCIAEAPFTLKRYGTKKIARTEIIKPDVFKDVPRRFYRYGITLENLRKRLLDISLCNKVDYVFITSCMTYWYLGVVEVIKVVRQIFSDAKVVLGGVFPKLCPEFACGLGADVVFDGFMPFLGKKPAFYLYKNCKLTYGICITSFGCPFKCDYCASGFLWGGYKKRDINEVFEDINYQYQNFNVKDIAFYDDALLLDKERHFFVLCEKILTKGLTLNFHTPNGLHLREIDRECAYYLKKTGFKTIRLSLEGVDDYIVCASSFKTSKEAFKEAVANLKEAGFKAGQIECYILVGLPDQSVDAIKRAIDFASSLGVKVRLAEYSPVPFTKTYQQVKLITPQIEKEPLLHNSTVYSTYIANFIPPKTLQELKDYAKRLNEQAI